MIRSFLFAVGLIVGVTGIACLQVDRVVLKSRGTATTPTGWRRLVTRVSNDRREVIQPPEWAAYALMSVGAVTTLYTLTMQGSGKAAE